MKNKLIALSEETERKLKHIVAEEGGSIKNWIEKTVSDEIQERFDVFVRNGGHTAGAEDEEGVL